MVRGFGLSRRDKLTSCGVPHVCDMACDCAHGGSATRSHGAWEERLRTRAYGRGGVLWQNQARSCEYPAVKVQLVASTQHGTQSVRGECNVLPIRSSAPLLLGGGLKESIIGWGSGRRRA